jgi:Mannosyl-glycoprotein endo-beta-N-acetylglucosaminidase
VAPGAVATQHTYGIPASVTIAQAILESGWGQSYLASKDHNLFGIKGRGPAGSDALPTQEYVDGQWVNTVALFRVYDNFTQSIEDHGQLLATSGYYQRAMAVDQDPNAFANALTGVYATDPDYGAKLISLMQEFDLYRYDTAAPSVSAPASPAPVSPAARSSAPASRKPVSRGAAPASPTPTSRGAASSAPASPTPTSRSSAPASHTPASRTSVSRSSGSRTAASRTSASSTSASRTSASSTAASRTSASGTAASRTSASRTSASRIPVSRAPASRARRAAPSPAPIVATAMYRPVTTAPARSSVATPLRTKTVSSARRPAAAAPRARAAAPRAQAAAAYLPQIPLPVKNAFSALAKMPLTHAEELYRDVAGLAGISWELLAACDWMQCRARPRFSPVHGEKLGTPNPDGTVYHTKSAALEQCAFDLADLALAVYGIDLTAASQLSVRDLARAFAAFRWGGLLKRHHTSAMEFPYSVAGLTDQHMAMRWPSIDAPNTPDRPGARFRLPFGAVPIVIGLSYPATAA